MRQGRALSKLAEKQNRHMTASFGCRILNLGNVVLGRIPHVLGMYYLCWTLVGGSKLILELIYVPTFDSQFICMDSARCTAIIVLLL
jgi:hypothetical protein